MIIVLPAVLDLRSNGEALSQITTLKTEATSYLDLIMKNMIGVYDTTKYGSIPFVYAGLLPLVLCLFYFASRKVPLKNKFCTAVFSPYLSQVLSCSIEFVLAWYACTEYVFIPLCLSVLFLSAPACRKRMGKDRTRRSWAVVRNHFGRSCSLCGGMGHQT